MTDQITPPVSERRPLSRALPKILLVSTYYWLPLVLFVTIAREIRSKQPLPGDIAILQSIHSHASPVLTSLAVLVTDLGGASVVIPAVIVAAAVLYKLGHRRQAVFLGLSTAGTAVLNVLLKVVFHRQRPALFHHLVTENDFSFPSGHAMITSAIAFSVILILWNTRYRWYSLVFGIGYVVLVGLSRLYLGVHYPSDVIGGWVVSFLWVLTVHYVFGRFGRRSSSATRPAQATTK